MRTSVRFALASLSLVAIAGTIAACSDARATESVDAEIKRDLELASATTLALAGRSVDSANLSSLETKPASAPVQARVVKRAAGPRAVRSSAPTVRATLDEVPAAAEMEGESLADAAAPETAEPVATIPMPAPVVTPAGDYGSGGGMFGDGGGRIGGGGGLGGVVIRGGGVDGDNCELHRRGRGTRGPIYVPAPRTQPTTVSTRPPREGVSVGSRNPGTVSRRPATSVARPTRSVSRPAPSVPVVPGRGAPRVSRRGL